MYDEKGDSFHWQLFSFTTFLLCSPIKLLVSLLCTPFTGRFCPNLAPRAFREEPWLPEVRFFSRVRWDVSVPAGRSVHLRLKAEATRGERLDRIWKPRIKSLWYPVYCLYASFSTSSLVIAELKGKALLTRLFADCSSMFQRF